MKRLNLFKKIDDRTEDGIKKQKIITRVYLFLLTGSIIILVLFNLLNTRIMTITVSNPSFDIYNDLQNSYSTTLKCPCKTMTIPYRKFMNLSPTIHEICSSDFVGDRWVKILKESLSGAQILDWRNQAFGQFQLLLNLCKLVNQTIKDAIERFLLQSFVTLNVLNKTDFEIQLNSTIDQVFRSMVNYFDLLVNTIDLIMQVDQPFTDGVLRGEWFVPKTFFLSTVRNSSQFILPLRSVRNIHSPSEICICATNWNCQSSVAIRSDMSVVIGENEFFVFSYVVPGSILSCSVIQSLLLSTLECFYSDSDCLSILKNYLNKTYTQNVEDLVEIKIQPLIYNSSSSRFSPKTSISNIIRELMIEQRNPSWSYKTFYDLCSPNYCTYSRRIRQKTLIEIMVILVSMIGGLIVSIRLITPYICIFIMNLFTSKKSKKKQQVTAKYLGQWATRLYIILFFICLTIFFLFIIVQPQVLTKTFDKPSFDFYNSLKQQYDNQLDCSCSNISLVYYGLISIEPLFHEICLSQFVSDQWRIDLTKNMDTTLSTYDQQDYRRFLSAHLQFLQQLCHFSIKSENSSIEQFLSSLFVTNQLLSEKNFNNRLFSLIEQIESNAPAIFKQFLSFIRSINHGNAIISTYGSNYKYIVSTDTRGDIFSTRNGIATTEGIIYDKCSCGLYSNCTSQANFIDININSSKIFSLQGLKIGCTPSESFRSSTLECFYNQTCLNLIQQYTNYPTKILPLSRTMNQFSINMTINELLNQLFVEKWNRNTTVNYSSYYERCLPSSCSFTYTERFSILYTITVLLSFQGGLTIVLKWISPHIVRIVNKIYNYRKKKRISIVEPVHSIQMPPVETVNKNIYKSSSKFEPILTNKRSRTHNIHSTICCSYKIVIICVLVMFVIIALVLFSIYIARKENINIVTTVSSTDMANNTIPSSTTATKSTSTTTTKSSTKPAANDHFYRGRHASRMSNGYQLPTTFMGYVMPFVIFILFLMALDHLWSNSISIPSNKDYIKNRIEQNNYDNIGEFTIEGIYLCNNSTCLEFQ
ncbi:hypothetical protein I4U23_027420 [Adineta vaga]|nr:hypothetical protein I4U23_027420 [Adineta vaga]